MVNFYRLSSVLILLVSLPVYSQKFVSESQTKNIVQTQPLSIKDSYLRFVVIQTKIFKTNFKYDLSKIEANFRKSGISFVPDVKTFLKLKKETFLSLTDSFFEVEFLLNLIEKEINFRNQKICKKLYIRYRSSVDLVENSNFESSRIDEYISKNNFRFSKQKNLFLKYSEKEFFDLAQNHSDELSKTILFIEKSLSKKSSSSTDFSNPKF